MLHLREVLALQDGERVVRVLRRSLWTTVPGLFIAGLFIVLPFFFLFPLLRIGAIGTAVVCISIALGLYLALKQVLLWDANIFVLTDRRFIVVKQRGLWSRRVIEGSLRGCQVSPAKRPLHVKLFRFGDVLISANGFSSPVRIEDMPTPVAVAHSIHGLRDALTAGFMIREVQD